MSCLGTLIGGTIGLFLGGPLGAIAGAAFGSFLSSRGTEIPGPDSDRYSSWYGNRMNTTQHSQMTFFVGAFSMLAKLASVDGRVSDSERRKIEEFMDKDLNLDPATKASAFRIFDTALTANETFHQFANQFYREFRFQSNILELMIDIMLRIAAVDGGISRDEETLIVDAVHIFHMDENRYSQLKARYTGNGKSSSDYGPYSVIGCTRTDSDEKLKKAYRKLVSEYHPDRISSKGLPEEFQKVAEQKFIEIQKAWDQIKKERNL